MSSRDIIFGLCGIGIIVWALLNLIFTIPMFKLTSPAFEDGGTIPAKYTCDTENARPPEFLIGGAPEGTKSFVLIMEDPDIPNEIKQSQSIQTFVHWVLYDIPGDAKEIILGSTTSSYGITSARGVDYVPPCPPQQYEPREHRYVFTLYALSDVLNLGSAPSADQARAALAPYLLAETKLVGRYAR